MDDHKPKPQPKPERRRIIVGISGASGAVYGVRLLEALRGLGLETHAVVSRAGWLNIEHELGIERRTAEKMLADLVDVAHPIEAVGASIASGSFRASAMVIAPCSMRTLAAIAHGMADNLLTRAADVTLKERRRLILLTREAPLHLVHLRNMTAVTEMGAIVCPPVPAFYQKPKTVEDIIGHTTARVLELLGLEHQLLRPWVGL